MSQPGQNARAIDPGLRAQRRPRIAQRFAGAISLTGLVGALLVASAGGWSVSGAGLAGAAAGRQSFFYENATLSLSHEEGASIRERGVARGTYDAPVMCTFDISPGHNIKASYWIYPKGGSVSGEASARYVIKGGTGYFGGYMTIKRGTGRFRHFAGHDIGFSGTIDRYDYKVTIKVHGWLSH